jgi:LysR family glycine cleavage system transcriptional activator
MKQFHLCRVRVTVVSKRPRNLPLHVLPAFEAAARHASFRLAAAELHLTPSAISHQIRTLEDALGMRLFQRLPRGLKLTDAGAKYADTVRQALEQLGPDNHSKVSGRLRVSMPDWVARLFVLPQLAGFRAREPHLDLEISTSMNVADLDAGEADVAIRLGMGQWGGLRSYRLAGFTASVVAAPTLAETAHQLSARGELPMVCLDKLEQHTRKTLAAVGLQATERVLRVDNYLDVVQAAEEGLGVAVLHSMHKRAFTTRKPLVALSPHPLPVPFAMFFVCRELEADRPDIAALRSSMFEAVAEA